MKIRHLLLLAALGLGAMPYPAQANCHGQTGGNELVGTLLGAALGGLVGSQIGSGTGNKIAIGAGVLAGGLVGNKIGNNLDCQDRVYHSSTAQDSFAYQRSGTTTSWRNPDSGHAGTVTPTRTYKTAGGTYCRDFTQTITVDGRFEEATGTACREPDGTWRIVSG